MTLNFNPLQAMVMTCSRTKVQGQHLVISEVEWKQTDGQMDRGDCINVVGKNVSHQTETICFCQVTFVNWKHGGNCHIGKVSATY